MHAKCPKCDRVMLTLNQQKIAVSATFTEAGYSAAILKCGYVDCSATVGVIPDYWSLAHHTADLVIQKLRK